MKKSPAPFEPSNSMKPNNLSSQHLQFSAVGNPRQFQHVRLRRGAGRRPAEPRVISAFRPTWPSPAVFQECGQPQPVSGKEFSALRMRQSPYNKMKKSPVPFEPSNSMKPNNPAAQVPRISPCDNQSWPARRVSAGFLCALHTPLVPAKRHNPSTVATPSSDPAIGPPARYNAKSWRNTLQTRAPITRTEVKVNVWRLIRTTPKDIAQKRKSHTTPPGCVHW
jgi:hypothetical protein